jgi:hypothetical protein
MGHSYQEWHSSHMPGSVTVCSENTFKHLVNIVMPILSDGEGAGQNSDPPSATICLRVMQHAGVTLR